MSRIAYVNGRYIPYARALVHVDDRGYQFADSVYEVIAIYDGRLIDETPISIVSIAPWRRCGCHGRCRAGSWRSCCAGSWR